MGLVDYITRKQDAAKFLIFDLQFIVSQLGAIKCSAKRFLLSKKGNPDFSAQNHHQDEADLNKPNYDTISEKFAAQKVAANNKNPTDVSSPKENTSNSLATQNSGNLKFTNRFLPNSLI